jgi:hypothetical protein
MELKDRVMSETEPKWKITFTRGRVVLRSWIEFDGEKYIGMGSKKTFDEDGKLIDYTESPTGLSFVYE